MQVDDKVGGHEVVKVVEARHRVEEIFYDNIRRLMQDPDGQDDDVMIIEPEPKPEIGLVLDPIVIDSVAPEVEQARLDKNVIDKTTPTVPLHVLNLHLPLNLLDDDLPADLPLPTSEGRSFKSKIIFSHFRRSTPTTPARTSTYSLLVSTPESRSIHSRARLIALDPFDRTNPISRAWAQTKSNGEIVVTQGQGGVIDAVVQLEQQGLVRLDSTLEMSEQGATIVVGVGLIEGWFRAEYATPAKQLLVHALFLPDSQAPTIGATTVETFYAALKRAPRTVNGLARPEGSEEEQQRSKRREAKGKAREGVPLWVGGDEVEDDELLTPRGLKATLMPFQSRSVRWLLRREGMYVPGRTEEGKERGQRAMGVDVDDDELEKDLQQVVELPQDELRKVARSPLWKRRRLPGVEPDVWLNRVTSSVVVKDPASKNLVVKDDSGSKLHSLVRGSGLLAEEVGLGKTVEIISLILMHSAPERNLSPTYHDPLIEADVQPSSMTLVISPSVLTGQWYKEIARHAPGLRVLRYEGIHKVPKGVEVKHLVRDYDVMLTTYDVLRREVNVARKPHQRSLRSGPEGRPKYRRSMLVQIEFLRILIDEAQMLGDTASAASETAAAIPRKFSFAVTSTPLKARLEDLQGLLTFLRIEPFGETRVALTRLLQERATFDRCWHELGARTLKEQVEHELVIPPQDRFVVPCDFSPVEAFYYNTRYAEMLDSLQLNDDGSLRDPSVEWQPDAADLSRWLVSLRQLAIHPQIGVQNKRELGNVLKSVDEVLTTMRANAVSALQSDQRALLNARMTRAQYMMYDQEECERFEKAVWLFDEVVHELEPVIREVVESIQYAWKNRPESTRATSVAISEEGSEDELAGALGLGLEEEEGGGEFEYTDASTGAIKVRAKSEKERIALKSLGALRTRLRDLLFVKHSAWFFSGNAYFNMGKFALQEAEMYQKAEELRQTILRPYEKQVERATATMLEQIKSRGEDEVQIDELECKFAQVGVGIVARDTFEEIEVTTDVMNGWAELIWQWRAIILKLMERRVSVAGNDATGEEYAQRAEDQERANCYIEAYTIILGEWRGAITGERSALADQMELDVAGKQRKNRQIETNGPNRAKRVKVKEFVPIKERRVPTLEQGDTPSDILAFELTVERLEAKGEGKEAYEVQALRRLISRLREVRDAIDPDDDEFVGRELGAAEMEKLLLETEIKRLLAVTKQKEKVADRLRTELGDITRAFNVRIQYFKQLQALSDAVADPDTFKPNWKGYLGEMLLLREQEDKLEAGIRLKASTRRYLDSLNETGALRNEADTSCIICGESYTHGVLTVCAHLFCSECFQKWRKRSKQCAVCKRQLNPGQWQTVHYRNQEAAAADASIERGNLLNATEGTSKKRSLGDADDDDDDDGVMMQEVDRFDAATDLRLIPYEIVEEIEAVETVLPLSTKSDLLVKHVKYIRAEDPGAKVVIFSAWQESLAVLATAFSRNAIEFVSLDGAGKKEILVKRFVEDPNIAVFFLNTKAHSAGLTLTCARYVFLVEPVLHPSLEIQAVARVHRIGQTARTAVYQYYVSDSVDQRVAELRGRQGTSLFVKRSKLSSARESRLNQQDMSRRENKQGNKRGAADESVEDQDDIIRCLFAPEHFVNLQKSLLPPHLRAAGTGETAAEAVMQRMENEARGRAGQAALKRARLEMGAQGEDHGEGPPVDEEAVFAVQPLQP